MAQLEETVEGVKSEEKKESEESKKEMDKDEVKIDVKPLEDPLFLAWCLRDITGKTLEELADMFDTSKGNLSKKFRQWEKDNNMRKLKKKYIPYVERLFVNKIPVKVEEKVEKAEYDERVEELETEIRELKRMVEHLHSLVSQSLSKNIEVSNETSGVSKGVSSKRLETSETMPDLSNLKIKGDVDVNAFLTDVKSDISEIKQIMKLGVLTQWYIYAKDKGIPIKGVFDVEELLFGEKPPVMSEEEEEKDIEELLQRVKR